MVIDCSGPGESQRQEADKLLREITAGLRSAPVVRRCMMFEFNGRESEWKEVSLSLVESILRQDYPFTPVQFATIMKRQFSSGDNNVLAVQLFTDRTIFLPSTGSVLVREQSVVCWVGGRFLSIGEAKSGTYNGRSPYLWAKSMGKEEPKRVVMAANSRYYPCGTDDTATAG